MIRHPFSLFYLVYMDESGEEGDPGSGSEGDGGNTPAPEAKETINPARFEAVERAISLLANGHTELTNGLAQIVSRLDSPPKKEESSPGDLGDEVDLETMDRKQYTQFILGQMEKVLQKGVQPINEKFSKLDEKIDGHTLGTMVEKFIHDPKEPHPDFFEWKDEMRELVKINPNLTPARLYTLARAENRTKAEKLDEKYGLNKPVKKNGADMPISLFPRGGTSTTKGSAGKLSPNDAAEKAWNEVMSSLPGN